MSLLALKTVSVRLGERSVLEGIDLALEAGEILGLIGPNGAGKTTLLRAAAGLVPLSGGHIAIAGEDLAAIDRRHLARTLAYLPQGQEVHWPVTAETLVMTGRLPHRAPWRGPGARDRAAVAEALASADAADLAQRSVTELSGGERARVLLARALAVEPRLLLADEPVAGLDPGHQLDVMAKLRGLTREGRGVVVVMHDLTLAARFCDRLVLLNERTVAAEGAPGEVLRAETLARCYGIRAHRLELDGDLLIVPESLIEGEARR